MNNFTLRLGHGLMLALLVFAGACSSDSPTTPAGGNDEPGNLPVVPEPTGINWLPPEYSAELIIGMSNELDRFEPYVQELRTMRDDGTLEWNIENRHLKLACADGLPRNSSDDAAMDNTYISARPYLLHTRYWQKQVYRSVDPGAAVSYQVTTTWGASTTNTQSTTFSRTMGVEITAGGDYKAFSADVTAYYEETRTSEEINSVSITNETSVTETYSVDAPDSGTRIFVLWQLVDKFSLVDADTIPIDQSPSLSQAKIAPVAPILFPNESIKAFKTTDFN